MRGPLPAGGPPRGPLPPKVGGDYGDNGWGEWPRSSDIPWGLVRPSVQATERTHQSLWDIDGAPLLLSPSVARALICWERNALTTGTKMESYAWAPNCNLYDGTVRAAKLKRHGIMRDVHGG